MENIPKMEMKLPSAEVTKELDAITIAESGIRNIPTIIEVTERTLRIKCVMNTTHVITTKGFTFAIHSGEACSPTVRKTYFGIEAYN